MNFLDLIELDISETQSHDNIAIQLGELLKTNKTIRKMNISRNPITDSGACELI